MVDHYSEATQHNGQLEFAQSASQITLSTTEAEANVAWAQLAESDTRVTGKISNILVSFDAPHLTDLLMVSCVPSFLALTAQLEALQLAVGDATGALNGRCDTLEDRLQDVPVHTMEVSLHGVCHGAAVALAIFHVCSGHDLHLVEPGFLEENPDYY